MTTYPTSWAAIRASTVRSRRSSVGAMADLNKAVRLFNALSPFLSDSEEARLAMATDEGVIAALALAPELEGLGILEAEEPSS